MILLGLLTHGSLFLSLQWEPSISDVVVGWDEVVRSRYGNNRRQSITVSLLSTCDFQVWSAISL